MPRRFQFTLATIFWLTFLVPTTYMVGFGVVPGQRIPALIALIISSYVLKRLIERGLARPKVNSQQAHPLDD